MVQISKHNQSVCPLCPPADKTINKRMDSDRRVIKSNTMQYVSSYQPMPWTLWFCHGLYNRQLGHVIRAFELERWCYNWEVIIIRGDVNACRHGSGSYKEWVVINKEDVSSVQPVSSFTKKPLQVYVHNLSVYYYRHKNESQNCTHCI